MITRPKWNRAAVCWCQWNCFMTLPQIPSGDRNEKAVLLYLYTSPQQTAVDVCGVVDDIDAGSSGWGLCAKLPVYHGDTHKEKTKGKESRMLQTSCTFHNPCSHFFSTRHCSLVSMLTSLCTYTRFNEIPYFLFVIRNILYVSFSFIVVRWIRQ